MRTYNRELLFACRYRLGTASNFVVHMSEADNVYDPLCGSFVGDQGAWSTAPRCASPCPRTGSQSCTSGRTCLANQSGTVDVYGQILDATLEAGNSTGVAATTASALLLKHEFLDGGADNVTLATLGLSLEGVSQTDSIPPGSLLTLVHPGNDLVLRSGWMDRQTNS